MKTTKWLAIGLSIVVLVFGLTAESMARDQNHDRGDESTYDWNYCPYCGSRLHSGENMGPGMMYPGYGYGMMDDRGAYHMGGMKSNYGSNYRMGPGMMREYGPGDGMMHDYGPRYETRRGDDRYRFGNLSEQKREKLQDVQEQFYRETRPLQNKIRDEQYDLNKELDKESPDVKKLKQLQKELSKLRSEYEQKILEYNIEVREIMNEHGTESMSNGN